MVDEIERFRKPRHRASGAVLPVPQLPKSEEVGEEVDGRISDAACYLDWELIDDVVQRDSKIMIHGRSPVCATNRCLPYFDA